MKKFFCLIVVCLLGVLLSSCTGLSDWTYKINDSYVIGHIDSANNHLLYSGDDDSPGWSTVVGGLIFEIQYNASFVGVNNGYYYLVDMNTAKKYGPFETVKEYTEQCTLLNTGELCEWIRMNTGG